MFSNSHKKTFVLIAGVSLALSSCIGSFQWGHVLSNNVLWSSDDGRIKIWSEGMHFDKGYASVLNDGEEVAAEAYFNETKGLIIFSINKSLGENEVGKYCIAEYSVKSVVDGKALRIRPSGNYQNDNYSETTLTSRPLEESELDARYFGNAWINKETGLFIRNNLDYLSFSKDGEYKGSKVVFSYCVGQRFEIKYETGSIFASGNYITHFEYMDLIFDEDCGKEEFGESLRMYTAAASGVILSLSDMKN
ncbi:MAG: hypothetical protein IKN69_01780 [Bacilli bacterium]|nr:hypothetical protein [Bacilli bacterium]MBR6866551.1 hypothetical protein [Bacilli bacterium]